MYRNAPNAIAALAASGAGGEIKEAIQAGMEVTFHERGINAHGWSCTGYSIVDPETGVGSYLIEGKGNGGELNTAQSRFLAFLSGIGLGASAAAVSLLFAGLVAGLVSALLLGWIVLAIVIATIYNLLIFNSPADWMCFGVGFGLGAATTRILASASLPQFLERAWLFVITAVVGGAAAKTHECILE